MYIYDKQSLSRGQIVVVLSKEENPYIGKIENNLNTKQGPTHLLVKDIITKKFWPVFEGQHILLPLNDFQINKLGIEG